MSRAEHVIDGRGMEPPEPFERVMAALAVLKPGEQVLLILPREPFPLFRVLANRGYAWQCTRTSDATFEVTISQAQAE